MAMPRTTKPSSLCCVVELLQVRQLGGAGHAPGRPEIEQHHLAAVIAEMHLLAVEIAQREVAGLRAGDERLVRDRRRRRAAHPPQEAPGRHNRAGGGEVSGKIEAEFT